jgi:tryptophan synthase alpha chain
MTRDRSGPEFGLAPLMNVNRIDSVFADLRASGRKALVPFLTSGDPDLGTTAALVRAVVARGASLVELGVPYSDPIADGPVISASYNRALSKGFKLAGLFPMIAGLRAGPDAVTAPLVTMVSYAIVHRHGLSSYLKEAAEAGVDGLIVPDLPVEEAGELSSLMKRLDLRLIQLVTPVTPRERAKRIIETTTGFLYYVAVAGITGERSSVPPELAENVAWIKSQTDRPVCVGFGISGPEQVRALAPLADGLIVGSALVRRIAEQEGDPAKAVEAASRFVAELAAALQV